VDTSVEIVKLKIIANLHFLKKHKYDQLYAQELFDENYYLYEWRVYLDLIYVNAEVFTPKTIVSD
jgi:hypothetical protein